MWKQEPRPHWPGTRLSPTAGAPHLLLLAEQEPDPPAPWLPEGTKRSSLGAGLRWQALGRLVFVHSTSPAPAARRARFAGGAEELLLARRVRSSNRRRHDGYVAPGRRRTRGRSRRLSFACESGCARPGERRAVGARPKRYDALDGIALAPVPCRLLLAWESGSLGCLAQAHCRRSFGRDSQVRDDAA